MSGYKLSNLNVIKIPLSQQDWTQLVINFSCFDSYNSEMMNNEEENFKGHNCDINCEVNVMIAFIVIELFIILHIEKN